MVETSCRRAFLLFQWNTSSICSSYCRVRVWAFDVCSMAHYVSRFHGNIAKFQTLTGNSRLLLTAKVALVWNLLPAVRLDRRDSTLQLLNGSLRTDGKLIFHGILFLAVIGCFARTSQVANNRRTLGVRCRSKSQRTFRGKSFALAVWMFFGFTHGGFMRRWFMSSKTELVKNGQTFLR